MQITRKSVGLWQSHLNHFRMGFLHLVCDHISIHVHGGADVPVAHQFVGSRDPQTESSQIQVLAMLAATGILGSLPMRDVLVFTPRPVLHCHGLLIEQNTPSEPISLPEADLSLLILPTSLANFPEARFMLARTKLRPFDYSGHLRRHTRNRPTRLRAVLRLRISGFVGHCLTRRLPLCYHVYRYSRV